MSMTYTCSTCEKTFDGPNVLELTIKTESAIDDCYYFCSWSCIAEFVRMQHEFTDLEYSL